MTRRDKFKTSSECSEELSKIELIPRERDRGTYHLQTNIHLEHLESMQREKEVSPRFLCSLVKSHLGNSPVQLQINEHEGWPGVIQLTRSNTRRQFAFGDRGKTWAEPGCLAVKLCREVIKPNVNCVIAGRVGVSSARDMATIKRSVHDHTGFSHPTFFFFLFIYKRNHDLFNDT